MKDHLQQLRPSEIRIPALVLAELMVGGERNPCREDAVREVNAFACQFEVVDFGKECAAAYAKIKADLMQRSLKMGPNDLMIAASALAIGATLVTNNTKDFARVEGLALENWTV
ncbi:MAG: type II toxin-antitoxin system VapC family toxin [Coriobacteriia bacterium]|nr:type II toxin-antitoxin system VapC family toxin [Coriobacteriia bacterium]